MINCSVGILTFNSEKTLRRALESVKDFSDIIISDGGSTDATLEIAHEYGCTIIEQLSKYHPSEEPRHPISDFSAERNQLIGKAKESWYLWIDADEYISSELHSEIAKVTSQPNKLDGYLIRLALQSPDGKHTYRLPSPGYQIRLFNLSRGGKFTRRVHERFDFSIADPKVGKLEGAWCVPISKPDLKTYSWAVNYRLRLLLHERPPRTLVKYVSSVFVGPIKNTLFTLFRIAVSIITLSSNERPPLYYFRNRIYSQWVVFKILSLQYFLGRDRYTDY